MYTCTISCRHLCVRSYKYLKISSAQVISKDERKSINLSMSFKLINDNLHNFVFVLFNVKQCYDKAILFKYSGKKSRQNLFMFM